MRAIRNSVAGSRHTVSPGSHYSYIEREARASARVDTLVELGRVMLRPDLYQTKCWRRSSAWEYSGGYQADNSETIELNTLH